MTSTGYKILGFAVWQGGKWYLRRRFGVLVSRRVLTGAAVGAGVAVCVALAARRDASSS